jgi:hypothetical protein
MTSNDISFVPIFLWIALVVYDFISMVGANEISRCIVSYRSYIFSFCPIEGKSYKRLYICMLPDI